jgi:uncharacterized phage-associated protein
MASAHDVAKYILARRGEMSTWKLEKLVYYSQAWHLVWHDAPLYRERIEAWANGPVVPALYDLHRGKFNVKTWKKGDVKNLDKRDEATIGRVLKAYGALSGQRLSMLTHSEQPWREARAGLAPTERSTNQISLESMAYYYGALSTAEDAVDVQELDWGSITA